MIRITEIAHLDSALAAAQAEIKRLRELIPTCEYCEAQPATCLGCYEDHTRGDCGDECKQHDEAYACDECCGHANEDGHCWPLEDVAGVLTTAYLQAASLRAENERLRAVYEAALECRRAALHHHQLAVDGATGEEARFATERRIASQQTLNNAVDAALAKDPRDA